jgi:hypothetical protein
MDTKMMNILAGYGIMRPCCESIDLSGLQFSSFEPAVDPDHMKLRLECM